MNKKFFLLLFTLLIFPALLFAQSGKISGIVTDRETGEALPGANVILVGTSMGATSDLNGEFIILHVPVGTYAVQTRYIGYTDVTVENIIVNSGLTTRQNFQLPSEALEVGSVTIVAERPLINKTATNAVRQQTQEEIKNIPLRSVTSVIVLQPGVINDGGIHIRGGRSHEVVYLFEGANSRDILGGGNITSVIPEALEEFQVQAGGYNAEFGGGNSGMVRTTLRSGGPQYRVSIQAETDNFSNPGEKFLNTYSYGYSDYTTTLSGPVPFLGKKFKFFVAGRNTYYQDRSRRFYTGMDINHADEYIDENNFPLITRFYYDTLKQGIHIPSGNIPGMASDTWTMNGSLVWDNNPIIIRYATSLQYYTGQRASGNPWSSYLDRDRNGESISSRGTHNIKLTHIISPKTFYEVNLNYYDYRYKNVDMYIGDDYWSTSDSVANAQYGIFFDNWANRRVADGVNLYDFGMNTPGAPQGYSKGKRNYFGGSFAFTTQFKKHEIRLGGDFTRWTIRSYDPGEGGLFSLHLNNPNIIRDGLAGDPEAYGQLRRSIGGGVGYDVFGNELDDNTLNRRNGPRHPQFGSFYLQDKFEARDLVINAGIRMDYLDNDDFNFANPADPDWDPDRFQLEGDKLVDVDPAIQLSPRLGFAFPATDNTVFHFQYGKFIQAPRFNEIYSDDNSFVSYFIGGFAYTNPRGFNLRPERTTQYEIGFSHQFTNRASFDITAYYKDIRDQIQMGRIYTELTSRVTGFYNTMVNGDFATTKGIEFSLTLRRTNRLQAQVNYSYSSSLGTGSVPNGSWGAIELGESTPTVVTALNWHQPHTGSINLDYRFGRGDGGAILERMGANLLLTFTSGHPYTLYSGGIGQTSASSAGTITDARTREPQGVINSYLTPWQYTLNLRVDKTIDVGPFDAILYVYAQNLLNRRNVTNVYNRTGNAWDDGFLSNPELSAGPVAAQATPTFPWGDQAFVALYNNINLNGNAGNGEAGFGRPREIRAGIRFEF